VKQLLYIFGNKTWRGNFLIREVFVKKKNLLSTTQP